MIMNKSIVENLGDKDVNLCVPITETTYEGVMKKINLLKKIDVDMIEWRIDYYKEFADESSIATVSRVIKSNLKDKKLLCTIRTDKEGGGFKGDSNLYKSIYMQILDTGNTDLIDIEVFSMDRDFSDIINKAKSKKVDVIGSYHNFEKTPAVKSIYEMAKKIDSTKVDIIKLVFMPNCDKDVENVLNVMNHINEVVSKPAVIISMSEIGKITRYRGLEIGTRINYLCFGKESAPGQIKLEEILNIKKNNSFE